MSSFDGQRGGGGGAPRTRKPHEPFAWLKGLLVGEDRSPPPRGVPEKTDFSPQ